MKKILILIASLVLAAAVVTGATYSLQILLDSAGNSFSGGDLEGTVDEVFTPPQTPVAPGDPPYPKRVTVRNTADSPALVRVMVFPTLTVSSTGEDTPIALAASGVKFDVNTSHWADGGDGYYYYLNYLAAGQTTEPLFSSVTLDDSVKSVYGAGDSVIFDIDVTSECAGLDAGLNYRLAYWGIAGRPATEPLRQIDTTLKAVVLAHEGGK